MKSYNCTLILATAILLVTGCGTPMQKTLAKYPHWQKVAQHTVSEYSSHGSDLVWQTFPNPSDPLHQQIWNALWKKREIGTGVGSICKYYDVYLVTLYNDWSENSSFFYDPTNHFILNGDEYKAFMFYKGNREATPTNTVILVRHLLAVNDEESFIVNDANDIPHTQFLKDNTHLSFKELLAAKGIKIAPPRFIKRKREGFQGDSEYSVFVYMPCGGQLFRYEVRCHDGYFNEIRKFQIADDLGDCWYIM